MAEDFIRDHRGIVLYIDGFDSQGGDFGDEDSTEGIRKSGVYTNNRKGSVQRLVVVELNGKIVAEFLEGP